MKYCYNCNRITGGDPLYCNFCGRSYDLKLCPHKHPNPRHATACSQCGSRDFSTPQPRVPFWAPALEFLLGAIPGIVLLTATVLAIVVVAKVIATNPAVIASLAGPLILLGILWWMWLQIPRWFREAIHRLLKRRSDRDDRGSRQ